MPEHVESTRRTFLALSATAAAAAALGPVYAKEESSEVVAGEKPRPLGDVIRLGLVGVGGRGGSLLHWATHQKDSGKVQIVAIADPSEEHRRKALAAIKKTQDAEPEQYSDPEDYKRLIARNDVDAVVIATPVYLHARMYLECFRAGRHFYGEKPLAIEVGDTKALVAAEQKNPGVIHQIGFQRRASPSFQEGVQRIRDGAIGPPIAGRALWSNTWGPLGGVTSSGTSLWYGRRAMSGDWMLEQACHSWDLLCWAIGEMPIAATGRGRKDIFTDVDPERDVTDYYIAHLEFPGGLTLTFEHNWFCPHKDEGRFAATYERLQGPRGGIDLTDGKIFPRDKDGEVIQLAAPQKSSEMTDLAFRAFYDSLRSGRPSISPTGSAQKATLTGLLVRQAVDERRRVTMKEIERLV
jgi:predicted dehydrogenase